MKRYSGRLIFRRLGLAVLLVGVALAIWHRELIGYGISQARGQLGIIWNARPVETFLADPAFPDSLKQKLLLIQEVRRFAVDTLGLKDTPNYKTLFDQKGQEVMWVVTASEKYRLKPKEWSFPLLGAVPYKGFFVRSSAMELAAALEGEGWDVTVRNPGGWSTLGWFTDPILSKMLEQKPGELANLIIHEMVHATIFVKDSVTFNENLATFIGDRGAEQFLMQHFGPTSPAYTGYINDRYDHQKFVDHVLRGTRKLDSVYQRIAQLPEDRKAMAKTEMIDRIVENMDTLELTSGKKPAARFRKRPPNNAYFMSYIHYESGQEELARIWEASFNKDLRSFIRHMASQYPFL